MIRKALAIILKVVGALLAFFLVLILGVLIVFNIPSVQQKLIDEAHRMLEEKLQTKVKIGDIGLSLLSQDFYLNDLEVEDQEHRKMLLLKDLHVYVELMPLLDKKIVISDVDVEGVKANLYKPEDGPANYQFIVDIFKKDKSKASQKDSVKTEKKKSPLKFDIQHVELKDIGLVFNNNHITLGELRYDENWFGKFSGKVSDIDGQWELKSKKGPQTASFNVRDIDLSGKDEEQNVVINRLHFAIDNHKPRKNHNRPKRGFFDVGHLDVTADMKLTIDHIDKDSIHAELTQCVARDSVTGFNIKDLHFEVGVAKGLACLSSIAVQQESTVLRFDSATIVLPSKKEGRKFAFKTSLIRGRTELRDISRPFSPVLKNFKIPLELSVLFSGNDSTLFFKNIEVYTPDKLLKIKAEGGIDHLKEKTALNVHFHINKMTAKGKVKAEIINQFAVKKLMMNQLDALGTLTYTGDLAVLWKREKFSGLLGTAGGNMNFRFAIDENTKYIIGHVDTKSFQLGKVIKMKDIGDVGLSADFKVDIHKQRTAEARKKYGGKMPIGDVQADVTEVSYKGIRTKDLLVNITSNGGLVEGEISQSKKLMDWSCGFSFTDIDKLSHIKIRPNVKLKFKNLFKKGEVDEVTKAEKIAQKQAEEQKKVDQKLKKDEDKYRQKSADTTSTKKTPFYKRLFKKKQSSGTGS